MKANTPASEIRQKDREANKRAFAECLDQLPFIADLAVDVRYGLGGWAQAFVSAFPSARLLGFELDEETAKQSFQWSTIKLVVGPSARVDAAMEPDLLMADFNAVTWLKRKELEEEIERWRPQAIIFTDIAVSKLHLNWSAYGLTPGADMDQYWKTVWKIPRYRLVHWAQAHYYATTALWVLEEDPS